MKTKNTSLSIDAFKLAVAPTKNTQKLDFALQSFAKRNKYAEIYFADFIKASQHLPIERIDSSGNIRSKFEAYATSYVANAHAMVDSFPYVIYLTLHPLHYMTVKMKKENITEGNSNWTDGFHKSLLNDPKYAKLAKLFYSFMNDVDFLKLRKISNNHKHKFLTRIVNNRKTLKYEVIDHTANTKHHVDIEKFFIRIHNKLLPKIFKLYAELQACAT